jgi:murein L,D-transpeptidase YafK
MKRIVYITLVLFLSAAVLYYVYPEDKFPAGSSITRIVVLKKERRLLVYANDQLLKSYAISLGENPVGHKAFEGDERTPEGKYFIDGKNPRSSFYKNLGVSYPNDADKIHAKKIGLNPGGQIKIHGLRNGFGWIGKFHRFFNWTNGCIALTNEEVEEIYQATQVGTTIEIKP